MGDSGSGKTLIAAIAVAVFVFFFAMLGMGAALASTVAAPYMLIAKVEGWFKGGYGWLRHSLSEFGDIIDPNSNKTIHDLLVERLDCTNVSPTDRERGWCIQPVYAEQESPIPPDKMWMMPIWQAAAKKYGIPWELLAAVSAARTQFGAHNCPASADYPGRGPYRLSDQIWSAHKQAGLKVGHATTSNAPSVGSGCKSSGEPVDMKKDNLTNAYDVVDSTFATARALDALGAAKQWDYSEPSDEQGGGTCKLGKTDGYTYRYNNDVFGDGGYNKNLNISQDIIQLGLRYTYATYSKRTFPANFGSVPGEDDPRKVPAGVIDQLITAVGHALGMSPKIIEKVRPALHKTITAESGYQSASLQNDSTVDVNSHYPDRARGLFQFTPGTFWGSRVPGFNNIFNPLHNLIAAMNIMYHGSGGHYTHPPLRLGDNGVWPQGGGWSPHFRDGNPYAGMDPGNSATAPQDQAHKPVKIARQTDPTSDAVAKMSGKKKLYSSCYVAVVHDWYNAILTNPPLDGGALGRLGAAVKIAQQQLALHVHEIPDHCNRGPHINDYLASVGIDANYGGCDTRTADTRPWCAAFISWVFQAARVWPVTRSNVNGGKGSAAAVSFWQFGRDKNIIKPPTYSPSPGDLVLFDVNAVGDFAGHIGLVVGRTKSTFTTIEGNTGDKVDTHTYLRAPLFLALAGVSGFVALNDLYGDLQSGDAPEPDIVQKFIPFNDARRTEMAKYSKRHYGINSWQLHNPQVIVEHYTVSTTFSSAYNTFARDTRDSELHELPGTCAHFIVDTNGTIYQLVPLSTQCRHTVGLNYTSIGIEMVGMHASDILGRPKQLKAALHLTVWLMSTYGIDLADVIGHNESLTSPYHKEKYGPWKCQTHGDWTRSEMQIYRTKLTALAREYGVSLGPANTAVASRC